MVITVGVVLLPLEGEMFCMSTPKATVKSVVVVFVPPFVVV